MSVKLRFITQDTIVSWAIRAVTWSEWSHVELILPEGYLSAFGDDGVCIKPFNYCRPTRIAIGTVDCSDEVANKVKQFCEAQIDKPYDWAAIFGNLFHQDWTERDSYDCSMLIGAGFQYADWSLINAQAFRINPGMLASSPRVQLQEVPV